MGKLGSASLRSQPGRIDIQVKVDVIILSPNSAGQAKPGGKIRQSGKVSTFSS